MIYTSKEQRNLWVARLIMRFSSVQSLSHVWLFPTHELQHTRLPCPLPNPRTCSITCPSSRWYHPTISSFLVPFSTCPQSFPESGAFPMSHFFTSGGQSFRVSASASVLPMNIQDCFPLGLTDWIAMQSRDSQESSLTPQFKSINSLVLSLL